MQNGINSVVSGNILYLATAEVVTLCQSLDVGFFQVRKHCVPDLHSCFKRWLVELDFVEKATLEGLIHVLGKIGGGDEDAVEAAEWLKKLTFR